MSLKSERLLTHLQRLRMSHLPACPAHIPYNKGLSQFDPTSNPPSMTLTA